MTPAIPLPAAEALARAQAAEVLASQGRLDEAAACLDNALDLPAEDPESLVRLGALNEVLSRPEAAADCYRRALATRPATSSWRRRAGYRIGVLLKRREGPEAAAAWLADLLRADPGHEAARHMLTALRGGVAGRAPAAYMRDLFDTFAPVYDRLMIEALAYTAPDRLRQLVAACIPADGRRLARAVDLGCGTGLAAAAVRDRVAHLEGVDLSAASLGQAAARGVYDRLVAADLIDYLDGAPKDFDLMLAADVLNYFGDLEPVLHCAESALAPGGWLFASTESGNEDGFRLRPSGRFCHGCEYVCREAAEAGLTVVTTQRTVLRCNEGRPVFGDLFALQRPPAPAPSSEETV